MCNMMIPWVCQEEEKEAIRANPMHYVEHIYMNMNV